MGKPTRRLDLLLLIATMAWLGCGRPESEVVEDRADSRPSAPAGKASSDPGSAAGAHAPEKPAIDPEGPAAAVMGVVKGLRENRPQAVWEFLPAGYQDDVNNLVREFARRMDADVWNRSFKIAQRLVKLLETRKQFFLESPLLTQGEGIDLDQIAANWDAMAGLLATLAGSDISDLHKLRTIDVGAYLAETGGNMMRQLSALSAITPGDPFGRRLKKNVAISKVEVVRSEGDRAVLRLHLPADDANSEEVEFVRIEGKWIPARMAEQWDANIQLARERLAQMSPEGFAQRKREVMERLDAFESFLDRLEAATTAEEFSAALQKVLVPAVSLVTSSDPRRVPVASQVSAASEVQLESVTIVVEAELDAKTEEAIADKLLALTDNPDLGLALSEFAEGKTHFDVSPVKDAQVFAKKIHIGEVVRVDARQRLIFLELPESRIDN